MHKITFAFLTFIILNVSAQKDPTAQAQKIVEEGKRLYRSEMASWYGTDLFLMKYKDMDNVGGYFSYTENDISKCIFFSQSETPKVIGTISFDSTYNTKTATAEISERAFTSYENELYMLRKRARQAIVEDTIFKSYKNTSLNIIPLISNNEKKVYVLTGAQQEGVVIFGNDYLLTFDKSLKLKSTKQLHQNILPIHYAPESGEVKATVHSHLPATGDFITATDICTLMLYEKFAKWKQHNVVSEKYLNIWNCQTNELVVLPMKMVDKINDDQEQRHPK